MPEYQYTLKKEINGEMHEIVLSRDDVIAIRFDYSKFRLENRIWQTIKGCYGGENYTEFEGIIDSIAFKYDKLRDYGCDDEYAFEEAVGEYGDDITQILKGAA